MTKVTMWKKEDTTQKPSNNNGLLSAAVKSAFDGKPSKTDVWQRLSDHNVEKSVDKSSEVNGHSFQQLSQRELPQQKAYDNDLGKPQNQPVPGPPTDNAVTAELIT